MRIGNIPTEDHRSTSWRSVISITLLAKRASVSWRSSSTREILRMATTSKHCRWAPRVRVCSKSRRVISGDGMILMLSANVGMKSASASVLGLVLSGHCCRPYLLPVRMTAQRHRDFTGTSIACLKMCLQLWDRGCGFITTELQRSMGKVPCSGWARHILFGGLVVEGHLHGLLGRQI
jgi:hypothetical protein